MFWQRSLRSRRWFSYIALMIIVSLVVCTTGGNIYSYGSDSTSDDDEKDYVITVPEEALDYVVLSDEALGRSTDEIVRSDDEDLYISQADSASEEGDLVEGNVVFRASGSESDRLWTTEDTVKRLGKKYDIAWNYKMICADGSGSQESDHPVKVAVMDSGIDYGCTDVRVSGSVNLVETEQEAESQFGDLTGHGSSVAGVVHEIAPEAEVYSVKVLDRYNEGNLSRVVSGIYWCIDNGIDIINMSFGTPSNSKILKNAVLDAIDNGIVVIAASGNTNGGASEYPAGFDGVISVGSVGQDGSMSEYNAGPDEIDVYAPGEGILCQSMLGMFTIAGGTSMACAHAAGEAALVLGENPELRPLDVMNLMVGTSNKHNNANIIDAEYAGEQAEEYDEDKEIEHNEKELKVTSSWGNEHVIAVDYALTQLPEDQVLTNDEITAIKAGAYYPDIAHIKDIYHGSRGLNQIAAYMYLTAIARNMRNSYLTGSLEYPTSEEIFGKDAFSQIIEVAQHDIKYDSIWWNRGSAVADDKYGSVYRPYDAEEHAPEEVVKGKNYTLITTNFANEDPETQAKLKSYFLYGIALHGAGDTRAHSSYTEVNGEMKRVVHESQKHFKNSYVGADDPACAPNRWEDTKLITVRLIKRAMAGEVGQISDFYPNEMYRDRGYKLYKFVDKALEIKNSEKYKKVFRYIDYGSKAVYVGPAKLTKPTALKGAITAKWKPVKGKYLGARIAGYQIRYSKKADMTGVKKKTVKGRSKKEIKLSGLKRKTKYHFQIRSYVEVNGAKYYSLWSNKKTIRTL